jgi:probable phosphoglycerate mutase
MGLAPGGYRTDPRLMELHYGGWEGSTLAEIEEREPGSIGRRDRDKWNFLPPGDEAESYEKLLERAKPWVDALSSPTVCVTHGGIVRIVFVMFEDMAKSKAAGLEIPQDRVLKLENGRLEWL